MTRMGGNSERKSTFMENRSMLLDKLVSSGRDILSRLGREGGRERPGRREREKAFLENGSRMLEALVASCNGRPIPILTYSYEELAQATDFYDNSRLLHTVSRYYSYYHGEFEGRTISVKMFLPDSIEYNLKDVITDLAISAKMSSHKNVLRLTGCCLETRIPTLVFESVKDGTLADRIHAFNFDGTPRQRQSMTWESRLRVARAMAHAIAFLHTGFSRPIIHRGIKTSNILFDQRDIPKLSDFGLAISIPEGETHVDCELAGNLGYIGPEYMIGSPISEKADVYSFGMLLLCLLTGQPAINGSIGDEKLGSLAYYVLERGIDEIVDPGISTGERGANMQQQLQAVLDLAIVCSDEDPERRPTMVDVTKELRRIERIQSSPIKTKDITKVDDEELQGHHAFAKAAELRRLAAAKKKEHFTYIDSP